MRVVLLAISTGVSVSRNIPTTGRRLITIGLRGGYSRNMSTATIPATLIEASTAIDLHASGKCKFVDGSWHMGKDRDANAEYLMERIPGASRFDIDKVCDPASSLPHMLPSVTIFESAMNQMGLSNDDHVVVYSRHGSFSAPRAWYMLKTYGHHKVSVMNGGFSAWKAAGGPVMSGPIEAHSATNNFKAQYSPSAVVDANEVLRVVNTGCAQILDARSKGRFEGTLPEPRPLLVGGHMPGALSLPFTMLVKDDDVTMFKSPAEIRDAFKDAGVVFGSRVVLTCGSGVSAAVLALGLNLMGIELEQTPIYDGSWSEWGDPERTDLPKCK